MPVQNFQEGFAGKLISINLRIGDLYTPLRVYELESTAKLFQIAAENLRCGQIRECDLFLSFNGTRLSNAREWLLTEIGMEDGSFLDGFLVVRGGMQRNTDRQSNPVRTAQDQLLLCSEQLQDMKVSITAMVDHVNRDLVHIDGAAQDFHTKEFLDSKGTLSGRRGVVDGGSSASDIELVADRQRLRTGLRTSKVVDAALPIHQVDGDYWGGIKEGLGLLTKLSHVIAAMGGAWEHDRDSRYGQTEMVMRDDSGRPNPAKAGRPTGDGEPNRQTERAVAPFDEDEDDLEVFSALFSEIDIDENGEISVSELEAALAKFSDNDLLSSAVTRLIQDRSTRIDFDYFKHFFRKLPRIRGERVRWAATLRLETELARHLMLGDVSDGLKGLKSMTDDEADQHIMEVCSGFSARLPVILKSGLDALRSSPCTNAQEFINSKFSMDGAFIGDFAGLQDFHDGPEKHIGAPNPQVDVGIRREHCERKNANKDFTTPNYNITTKPKVEYEFVFEPQEGILYPHTPRDRSKWSDHFKKIWKGGFGRDVVQLVQFMNTEIVKQSSLKSEEVGSLRLYSGPMYALYNAVLRNFPKYIVHSLEGNKYETTIFCITSGIMKLSKFSKIPQNRRLYRGLGGMILPDKFLRENEGFRGGVEWGLMSTTTNKDVAIQYSGIDKRRGSVFEIIPGRIDIGAELSWVSQYPGEEEYLFPPLSCLEVIDEPQVVGQVVVFPLRVNINLKGMTLEQLVERRKDLHMAMIDNLQEALGFEALALIDKYQIRAEKLIHDEIDQGDRLLLEELIQYMQSVSSDGVDTFANFELQKVNQPLQQNIDYQTVKGMELAAESLDSIRAVRPTYVKKVSIFFENSTSYVRVFVVPSFSSSTSVKFQCTSIYDELSKAIQTAEKEFNSFLKEQRSIKASDYNVDEKYKELTKTAIEAKALVMKKITYYIRECTKGNAADANLLKRILATPFDKYSSESIALELETGVFDFPWSEVLDQKETIDLKTWNPASLTRLQLTQVRATIAKHTKWVRAWVHGQLIEFPGGMMAKEIVLEKPPLPECALTVGLLLSANTSLTRLRISATAGQLGAEEWGHIAKAVKGHPNLQDLADFEWAHSVLQQGVTSIKLNEKALGDAGAVVLSHLMQRNCSTIETLLLRANSIGPAGATSLANTMKHLTALHTLDLRQNHLDAAGWTAVADALEPVTSLTSLNGGCLYADIRAGGQRELALGGTELVVAMARYLPRSADTLTTLDLSANSLGPTGATCLASALQHLTALQTLDLRFPIAPTDSAASPTQQHTLD